MMIKLNEVKAKTGLGRSSIYSFIDKGTFPAQVKLGQRCVAWVESEIDFWIDGKINARYASNDESFINKIGCKK